MFCTGRLLLYPCRIAVTQKVNSTDYRRWHILNEWAQQVLKAKSDFGQKIIFSIETHFLKDLNMQNYRLKKFSLCSVIVPYIFGNEAERGL